MAQIEEARYFHIEEMEFFGDKQSTLKFLTDISKLYGRYVPENLQFEYLVKKSFDQIMTSDYDTSAIRNWDQILYYMKLYLNRVVSSTPFYKSPYSRETTYILKELFDLNQLGILTIDSQPGFYIEEFTYSSPYLQLPYIKILAPENLIKKIITVGYKFQEINRFFSLVYNGEKLLIEDYTSFINNSFPNVELNENFKSLYFGVRKIYDANYIEQYLDYILTNKFFQDFVQIVTEATYTL